MPSGSREVIAATIFIPTPFPNLIPPADAYMRNCSGSAPSSVPDHVAVGHFRVFVPQDVDPLRTSITARANFVAAVRDVTVQLTKLSPNNTQVDIYLRDNTGVDVDTADQVEVTLSRLPI
jgi:hypothetical protein